jgi:hypothetical protein
LSLWQRSELALAIDATAHGEKTVALVISVLYRGSALPLAWQILPANRPGPWMPHILGLVQTLAPEIPHSRQVLVLTDRGLWSPRLWQQLQALGLHPLMRVKNNTSFHPDGGGRLPVGHLVPGPGYAWIGKGTAFRAKRLRPAGHPHRHVGPRPKDPLGGADRLASRWGGSVLVWTEGLDRVGLPCPQGSGLAVAAHPPDGGGSGGALLAGIGGGYPLYLGLWHSGGGCRGFGCAARPAQKSWSSTAPSQRPAGELVQQGSQLSAAALVPRQVVAAALADS